MRDCASIRAQLCTAQVERNFDEFVAATCVSAALSYRPSGVRTPAQLSRTCW